MANTIGTAYINIAPNMTGIQGKIAGGLRGAGSQFADQFGGEITGRSAVVIGAIAGIAQAGVTKAMSLVTNSISSAIGRVDTLNAAAKTFQYMGFTAGDSSKAVKDVTASIQGLPTPLDGAIRGMSALAATYGNVGLGQKVFTALNDGILGMGGSADMVSGAVMQLSQLPLDGPLDAQTWNSLRNSGLTPVMVAMGKDMGKSVSQLKADFGSGKLTVQDFTNELLKMDSQGGGGLTNLHSIALNATGGIGTGFANMQTAITRGIANIIQAIGQKNISDAIAAIGKGFEKVLDIIAKDVPVAIGYIKGMIDFVDKHKTVFEILAVMVGAAATAMLGLMIAAKVSAAIGAVQKAIEGAQIAMATYTALTGSGTGAMVAFDAAFDANPIGIIVVAIAALVAGLIFFFTKTELGKKIFADFLSFLGTVWSGIKTGFKAVADFFTGVWNGITTGLAAVGNFFKGIWDSISNAVQAFLTFFGEHWRIIIAIVLGPLGLLIDFVTAYWSEITGAISTALNAIWGVISTVFNAVVGFIGGVFSTIGGYIATAVSFYWNIITTVFSAIAGFMGAVFGPPINAIIGVFQWLGGIVGSIVGGIWNGITSAFNAVTGFLGGVGSKIMGIFSGAGSWLFNTGKDIINGLINGASSLLSKIGEMFLNIIPGWIKDPFKKALGIHSPSTVFAGYAHNTIDGYTNTIADRQSDVTGAITGMANAAMDGMTTSPIAAQFATSVNGPVPSASATVASGNGPAADPNAPAVVQNNNIYNQVDLNSVTRELAWQIRR
jgi:tape measure domain-containing protein